MPASDEYSKKLARLKTLLSHIAPEAVPQISKVCEKTGVVTDSDLYKTDGEQITIHVTPREFYLIAEAVGEYTCILDKLAGLYENEKCDMKKEEA